jgi:hypothetical protein
MEVDAMFRTFVVEGCSGSGKSAISTLLAERTGAVILPLMRRQEDAALDGLAERNTYVQDIYAMDVLANLNVPVVYDRAMPSALCEMYEQRLSTRCRNTLIDWWARRLIDADGLIIRVMTPPNLASSRSRHKFSSELVWREQQQIKHWCDQAHRVGVQCLSVVNNNCTIDAIVAPLLDLMVHLPRSASCDGPLLDLMAHLPRSASCDGHIG